MIPGVVLNLRTKWYELSYELSPSHLGRRIPRIILLRNEVIDIDNKCPLTKYDDALKTRLLQEVIQGRTGLCIKVSIYYRLMTHTI
jgi:hypothetical protein